MTPPTANDNVDLALERLRLLEPETRELVLSRMNPDKRALLEERMLAGGGTGNRPHADLTHAMAEKRRLMRTMAASAHSQRVETVEEEAEKQFADPEYVAQVRPLEQLRLVHPAALARAMQGERAEAWALVLDFLGDDSPAAGALRMYLDDAARLAIETARNQQQTLPDSLKATIEKAIGKTVVPLALREHEALMNGGGAQARAAY